MIKSSSRFNGILISEVQMAPKPLISILIPTYNRRNELLKNINLLSGYVRVLGYQNVLEIIISDNCSADGTAEVVKAFIRKNKDIKIQLFEQSENIGLERNALFLLQKATLEFVMFIGDDDYLPNGYLKFVVDTIGKDTNTCAVIPGITALYPDGTTDPRRYEKYDIKKYPQGFDSCKRLSFYGHQLSGILLRREKIAEKYLKDYNYRNIYPFIFFLGHNILRGSVYYAPVYCILVTQGNSKDWKYDNSGLLSEIFKNYDLLFPDKIFNRYILKLKIIQQQPWRLRIGKNIYNSSSVIFHLFRRKEPAYLATLSLFLLVPYLYFNKTLKLIRGRRRKYLNE